jgi:hypothetical protein
MGLERIGINMLPLGAENKRADAVMFGRCTYLNYGQLAQVGGCGALTVTVMIGHV